MRKKFKIELVFDRANREYSPGDIIYLEVHLQIKDVQTFCSFYVKIKGSAFVSSIGRKACSSRTLTFLDFEQNFAGSRLGTHFLTSDIFPLLR